ncbi:hypothetical protein ABT41_15295 [Brucella melitensis]|nr:hypothetical protein ABT41_15295 [Brucella melitensis]
MQGVTETEHHGCCCKYADEWIDAKIGKYQPGNVTTQHNHRAVGEVDDVQHAPDQSEALRHDGIEPAQKNAIDDDL